MFIIIIIYRSIYHPGKGSGGQAVARPDPCGRDGIHRAVQGIRHCGNGAYSGMGGKDHPRNGTAHPLRTERDCRAQGRRDHDPAGYRHAHRIERNHGHAG